MAFREPSAILVGRPMAFREPGAGPVLIRFLLQENPLRSSGNCPARRTGSPAGHDLGIVLVQIQFLGDQPVRQVEPQEVEAAASPRARR
jgi:hypothetical protein